jgi:hypothetical protein
MPIIEMIFRAQDSPVAVIAACDHREARSFWKRVRRQWQKQRNYKATPYLFDVPLACGHRAFWRTWVDIPLQDTPCPCGDPMHYLIQYRPHWGENEAGP